MGGSSIVKKIISCKANYVIGLKDNQPNFLTGVKQAFETYSSQCQGRQYAQDVGVDHGRIEERNCRILSADLLPDYVPKEDWAGLNTIVQIETARIIIANGTVGREIRYYISSLDLPANQIAAYVRGHWGIENQLHYMLDVFWGEDYSRKQTANAATNFGSILRIAHNLVKSYPETISVKRKLKKADRSDEYREKILRFAPSP